jgi:ferrous iron transport protein B
VTKKLTIALAGNPNAGKTTLFNAITGARQHITNYPGVTVEKKSGRVTHRGYDIEVVDLPGTYSLTAYSLEEIVARDFLVKERPDLVVNIVDASNLDRNLYLTMQFEELGVPLLIALNMMDEAASRGIVIDLKALSGMLGVPVVPTVARSHQGIPELLNKVVELAEKSKQWNPGILSYGRDVDQSLQEIVTVICKSQLYDKNYSPEWLALKSLEGDQQILSLIKSDEAASREIEAIRTKLYRHTLNTLDEEPEGIIADHRYGFIAGVTKKAVKRKIESRLNLSDRIDKVLTNRIVGPLLMMSVLYVLYEFTFWAGKTPVEWIGCFFGLLRELVAAFLPEGTLRSLMVSGVIDGVGGVFGFVPLIMFMFLAVAILEDSGYMARMAFMLDRVLRWFGLHGNSVMALLIGGGISGGCAVPGIMATRTLRDPKERIATLLVVPFMNCGAKLPIFGMLIAAFFSTDQARMLFAFTLLSWGFALLAAKLIRSTVLKGPTTPFVMELPPYRLPTIRGLLIHTWERTWQYMKKAGTIILAVSIVLWAMMTFPGLSQKQLDRFESERLRIKADFLASPEVMGQIPNERALTDLDKLFSDYRKAAQKDPSAPKRVADHPLLPIVKEAHALIEGAKDPGKRNESAQPLASAYAEYRQMAVEIGNRENEAALEKTVAGRLGRFLEKITGAIGFDYKVNIALVGGFVAKEVIVSTLGTAYSLGSVDPEEASRLAEKLKRDSRWTPLRAFTLILFTMLYVPCFATLVVIRKESSLKWVGFSVAFNLIVAYGITFAVYQGGKALGIGV